MLLRFGSTLNKIFELELSVSLVVLLNVLALEDVM